MHDHIGFQYFIPQVRAKLVSHLIVNRKPVMDWSRVPSRAHLNKEFYNPTQLRDLLAEVGLKNLRGKERRHMEIELQTAASCSCKSLFACEKV